MKTVYDIPGLVEELDRCQAKVSELVGAPVAIHYELKVHSVSLQKLSAIICEECDVTWDLVKSPSRKGQAIIARHLFCFFGYNILKRTLKDICEVVGGRDHTTVIHARDKIWDMLHTKDELYMPYIRAVEHRINKILVPNHDEAKANQ